jgi:hypothetical protein
MINPFRPAFKKVVLQKEPLVLLWQPRNQRDVIIEIQDKDYRLSDEMVNFLANLTDDLTLTTEDPKIPQVLLGGSPFAAMQTSMAFSGTSVASKEKFIYAVVRLLEEGKALTPRNEELPTDGIGANTKSKKKAKKK